MKLFYTLEGATPGDGGNSLVVAGCWQRFKGRSESARRVTAAILCTSVSILQRPKVQCVANITENEMFVSQGRTQGGVLGLTPPLNLLSYENVITYAKEFVYVFVHFLLVLCQLNAQTTEWFCMKISKEHCKWKKYLHFGGNLGYRLYPRTISPLFANLPWTTYFHACVTW